MVRNMVHGKVGAGDTVGGCGDRAKTTCPDASWTPPLCLREGAHRKENGLVANLVRLPSLGLSNPWGSLLSFLVRPEK